MSTTEEDHVGALTAEQAQALGGAFAAAEQAAQRSRARRQAAEEAAAAVWQTYEQAGPVDRALLDAHQRARRQLADVAALVDSLGRQLGEALRKATEHRAAAEALAGELATRGLQALPSGVRW